MIKNLLKEISYEELKLNAKEQSNTLLIAGLYMSCIMLEYLVALENSQRITK